MPVTITKPQATLRELLAGLKKRTGLFGEQVMRANTASDFYSVVGTGRNRIINGAIVINQRAFNASITDTGALTYTTDRWGAYGSVASKFSVQQTTGTGDGFSNSLLATSSSSYTVSGSEIFKITQLIEGYNIADLNWGSITAKPVTLSFWVKCSLTGTFGGCIINSAFNRNYPFSYTISSANTWEQKTITIPGDTTGTWLTTNGIGMQVIWSLGTGSGSSGPAGAWASGNIQSATGTTNVLGTNGATWQVTGVQLERGTVATPFEYRSYGQELALCQRYYQQRGGNSADERFAAGFSYITTQGRFIYPTRVVMRATPTLTVSSGTDFNIEGGGFAVQSTSLSLDQPSPEIIAINCNVASGLSQGGGCQLQARNSNARIMFSAEL